MRVLIVCSKNSGNIAPFIIEQVEALNHLGIETEYFTIKQKGVMGYLKSRKSLLKTIADYKPDLLHAHFGLSGLLANLQHKIPVVTTYHGCDINKFILRIISLLPLLLSKYNIFVSKKQAKKVFLLKRKHSIIPCGINYNDFYPLNKQEQRDKTEWEKDKKIILFSSDFNRTEKNAKLAFEAINMLKNYQLVELKGYNKKQMCQLMNACDAGLLTSIREGSPMFVKEMMACSKPMVCTDVGDIREQINGIEGCKITRFNAMEIKQSLEYVVQYETVEYPLDRLEANNNELIAKKLHDIYSLITK